MTYKRYLTFNLDILTYKSNCKTLTIYRLLQQKFYVVQCFVFYSSTVRVHPTTAPSKPFPYLVVYTGDVSPHTHTRTCTYVHTQTRMCNGCLRTKEEPYPSSNNLPNHNTFFLIIFECIKINKNKSQSIPVKRKVTSLTKFQPTD